MVDVIELGKMWKMHSTDLQGRGGVSEDELPHLLSWQLYSSV